MFSSRTVFFLSSMTMYCLIMCIVPHVQRSEIYTEYPGTPTKTGVLHEESDDTDVPSSLKVSEASYHVYR